jgi:hypothetical protein
MSREFLLHKLFVIAVLAVLAISAANLASATTISGNLTADNAFFAYVSTDNSVLGTLVASGNSWPTTFTISAAALTPGVTNYLQIEVINYGGPGGFIGDFTLSDAGFHFANGTQSLLTETTDWAGIYNSSNSSVVAQPWVQPTGATVSFGANGVAPWGVRPGISATADWIWPNDANSLPSGSACPLCTVDFSTVISPATTTVPEPGSMILFGSGLAALAGMLRRKLIL